MGFFTNSFTKPGPGVKKDAPEERSIVVFFKIWGRKFWQLIHLNLCYVVLAIPILALLVGFDWVAKLIPNVVLATFIQFLPLTLLAIPTAGLTYITRNFAREEPVFVWSDFIQKTKENWKISLIHGAVTYVASFILLVSCYFYYIQLTSNWVFIIPMAFSIIAAVIVLFSQYYMYIMIVTFDMKYKDMVKNCLLYNILGLFRNIGLSIFMVPVWGLTFLCLFNNELVMLGTGFFVIPFVVLGLIAFSSYLCTFPAYGLIIKYMIEPAKNQEEQERAAKKAKAGDHYSAMEETKVEYVFENGKLVKKGPDVESIFQDE